MMKYLTMTRDNMEAFGPIIIHERLREENKQHNYSRHRSKQSLPGVRLVYALILLICWVIADDTCTVTARSTGNFDKNNNFIDFSKSALDDDTEFSTDSGTKSTNQKSEDIQNHTFTKQNLETALLKGLAIKQTNEHSTETSIIPTDNTREDSSNASFVISSNSDEIEYLPYIVDKSNESHIIRGNQTETYVVDALNTTETTPQQVVTRTSSEPAPREAAPDRRDSSTSSRGSVDETSSQVGPDKEESPSPDNSNDPLFAITPTAPIHHNIDINNESHLADDDGAASEDRNDAGIIADNKSGAVTHPMIIAASSFSGSEFRKNATNWLNDKNGEDHIKEMITDIQRVTSTSDPLRVTSEPSSYLSLEKRLLEHLSKSRRTENGTSLASSDSTNDSKGDKTSRRRYSTKSNGVTCYCNLGSCASRGYICRSSTGVCYVRRYYGDDGYGYRLQHVYGCVEMLTKSDQLICRKNAENTTSSATSETEILPMSLRVSAEQGNSTSDKDNNGTLIISTSTKSTTARNKSLSLNKKRSLSQFGKIVKDCKEKVDDRKGINMKSSSDNERDVVVSPQSDENKQKADVTTTGRLKRDSKERSSPGRIPLRTQNDAGLSCCDQDVCNYERPSTVYLHAHLNTKGLRGQLYSRLRGADGHLQQTSPGGPQPTGGVTLLTAVAVAVVAVGAALLVVLVLLAARLLTADQRPQVRGPRYHKAPVRPGDEGYPHTSGTYSKTNKSAHPSHSQHLVQCAPPYTISRIHLPSSNKASQTSPPITPAINSSNRNSLCTPRSYSNTLQLPGTHDKTKNNQDCNKALLSSDIDDLSQLSRSTTSPTIADNSSTVANDDQTSQFQHYLKALDKHHHMHHHHHIHHTIEAHQRELILKSQSPNAVSHTIGEKNLNSESHDDPNSSRKTQRSPRKLGGFSSFRSTKSLKKIAGGFDSPLISASLFPSSSIISHHPLAGEVFAIPHSPTSPPIESRPHPDEASFPPKEPQLPPASPDHKDEASPDLDDDDQSSTITSSSCDYIHRQLTSPTCSQADPLLPVPPINIIKANNQSYGYYLKTTDIEAMPSDPLISDLDSYSRPIKIS